MSLQDELDALGARVAGFRIPPEVSDEEWRTFADNTVVALMAGGESSRFSAVLNGEPVHKNVYELPNGDTMIEMNIRMYRDAGIKKFVALVWHNAHSIEERLGNGARLGVEITYSHDPEKQVGKGGAVRNALDNGTIPQKANLIVVNPDDIIFDFPGSFPRYIVAAHLDGARRGMLATAVLAPGETYPTTGMVVVDGVVVDAAMYPLIPVPAHIGTTLFAPQALSKFHKLFSLDKKMDFEQILFPLLAQENKLWSAGLTRGTWVAVNDLKSYKQLVNKLAEKSQITGV